MKNPNQAALLRGASSLAARQAEDMFFESAAPWNRMSADQKGRLGEGASCAALCSVTAFAWLLHSAQGLNDASLGGT